MKKTRDKKVAKTMAINRKFFLKWSPFNFCDRFCERCHEWQNDCKVYQEDVAFKTKCLIEGKDPYDPEVVFHHISQMMQKTMNIIKDGMEKDGVKISKEDEKILEKESALRDKFINKQPLNQKCRKLAITMRNFLDNFYDSFQDKPWVLSALQKEIDEICFYESLVYVKAAMAVHGQCDEKEYKALLKGPHSLISAALGFYSLLACQKNLRVARDFFKDDEIIWVLKINELLKQTDETQAEFKKNFPTVERYKNKIIFHGGF